MLGIVFSICNLSNKSLLGINCSLDILTRVSPSTWCLTNLCTVIVGLYPACALHRLDRARQGRANHSHQHKQVDNKGWPARDGIQWGYSLSHDCVVISLTELWGHLRNGDRL